MPLDRDHDAAPASWAIALDLMTSRKGRGSFVPGELPDLTFAATDADWTHGSGPVVSGPAVALALALGARPALQDRLEGPGAETLRTWVGSWA